jgi:hypothetical protein
MTEKFLAFIWQSKLFNADIILDSERIEIIYPGEINSNAGPDFTNAKIKIGETLWVGNIEIHVNASDWYTHNHNKNAMFDNVILHVVWKNDTHVYTSKGRKLPTMELKFDSSLWNKYEELTNSLARIPCEKYIPSVESVTIVSWLSTLAAQRLESKIEGMAKDMLLTTNNWEEIFYRQLLRNFGFHVNSEPFSLLARTLPFKVLEKHSGNLKQIEALLFGQAGFLQDDFSNDPYFLSLKSEYEFLKAKYDLKSIDVHLWKFMRLRPANFPTIRIAQFAGMVCKQKSLLTSVLKCNSIRELQQVLTSTVSEYWETHYHFGSQSKRHTVDLGIGSVNTIIINTIIPFYFLYGKKMSDNIHCNKALTFLENIPPEKNSEINIWKENGVIPKNAFDTQALLFLKKEYCHKKRCVECRIGAKILIKNRAK